jgi:serine phosphatase RsbU (regulator of sigma subunit)
MPLALPLLPREQAVATLAPDDVLVMYSDGLVERRGELIDDGLARLLAAVEAHMDEPVQAIADAVIDELIPTRPRDDVVLLVKRVH